MRNLVGKSKMKCQRNNPLFCQGEAIGLIDNVINKLPICNGCRESNEPFIKRFKEGKITLR